MMLGVAAPEMRDMNHGSLGNPAAVARKKEAAADLGRKIQTAPTRTRLTALRIRSKRF